MCVFLLVTVPLFAQTAYLRTTVRLGNGGANPERPEGRTEWTGWREGSAMLEEQQTFTIHRPQGGLLPGKYLLTVRIKNSAGAVTTVENKVTAVK